MIRRYWPTLVSIVLTQSLAIAVASADEPPTELAAVSAAIPQADTSAAASPSSSSPSGNEDREQQKLEQLQQVTVTGRRQLVENSHVTLGAFGNKDTMQVPLSLESVSSAQLANSGARTLQDALSNDPGVQNDQINADYSNPSIRGFQSDWTNTIRRNDLNLAPYQETPLEEIDKITVLEGPSGFLYGFNSPGGTIDYITKQPTLDPFTELTLQRRTENGWYAHLDTSNTLGSGKTFGYRLNVGHEQEGELTKNFGMRRDFIAGALEWKVNSNTVLQLNADYQKMKTAGQPVLGIGTGKLPPLYDPWTLLGQPWLQYRADTYNVGTRLDTQLSDSWSITAQAAFSSNIRYTAFPSITGVEDDGDITGGKLRISPDQSYRVASGQLFATGEFSTFGISHEIVFGVSGESYKALEAGYINLPITVGNIFNPVYVPEPILPPNPVKNHNDVTQASPFASDLISLTKHWQALIGGRYIQFKNTITSPTPPTMTVYDRNKTVPNVGLIYRPIKDLMFYTDYTQGLTQSQPAPPNAANAGVTLAPLVSTQYELGTKLDLNGRFNVRVDAFQVTQNLQFLNSALYLVAGGQQRHRGLEVAANGRVTDGLTVNAGLMRLYTTQIDTGDDTVNGKRTPNAPNWQANVSLDYQLPMIRQVFVDAALQYVGDRPVDAANTVFVPAYTTVDLGVRCVCEVFGENMILRVNAKNLTNRRYWAAADLSGVFPGMPFTLYASATFEF